MDKHVSNSSELYVIRRFEVNEGPAKGIRLIEIGNETLRLIINESRGLDIFEAWYKGQNLSFISKNGLNNSTGDFAKRFEGGSLYTVGLDSAGVREGFPLHGSYHLLAPEKVNILENDEAIEVVGEVRDSALFGKNLLLKRRICLLKDQSKVIVSDTLVNEGDQDEKYCLLYHCNFGYPFLNEDCSLGFIEKSVLPRTTKAKENLPTLKSFSAPIDNEFESVYFIDLKTPEVKVKNHEVELTFSFLDENMPHFVLWKSCASHDYALGLEPTTTFLDDKFSYSSIKKGQALSFGFSFSLKDI